MKKMKILGAVLELPAKQHCQSNPICDEQNTILTFPPHSIYTLLFNFFCWEHSFAFSRMYFQSLKGIDLEFVMQKLQMLFYCFLPYVAQIVYAFHIYNRNTPNIMGWKHFWTSILFPCIFVFQYFCTVSMRFLIKMHKTPQNFTS